MRVIFWTLLLLVVAVWVASSALFTVDRAEFVYLTQFGKHVGTYDGKTDAGLHVKYPWPIQSVIRLDNRLQFFDLREVELLTHDSQGKTIDKTLMISAYVCWRIAGPEAGGRDGVDQFVRAVSTPERARSILEQRILSRLGAEIGKVSLDDLISAAPDGRIEERMDQIRARLLGTEGPAAESLQRLARDEYGIELIDIRLRRFNHPPSVRSDIYARIISERERKVQDYTSEGDRRSADIRSAAEREASDIRTRAAAQQKRLEEEAAAKGDSIRNEAHGKDREFYTFLEKLKTYQTMLSSSRDMLLLSSNHELFDLLLKPPRPIATPDGRLVAPREPLPLPRGPEGKTGP
jgi:membrane protease subunit HflC